MRVKRVGVVLLTVVFFIPVFLFPIKVNAKDAGVSLQLTPSSEKHITTSMQAKKNVDLYLPPCAKKKILSLISEAKRGDKDTNNLRSRWEDFFGFDLFWIYYKAKEVEDWVTDKTKVKIFKFEGKPKIKKDRIGYVFQLKF